jgi:hypothetical protein
MVAENSRYGGDGMRQHGIKWPRGMSHIDAGKAAQTRAPASFFP